jgi:enterochelin esterase-like enzyme
MHDGQMLFDSSQTWNKQEWNVDGTLGTLIEQRGIRDCLVVGIWNGGARRHSEYLPQRPFESLPVKQRDSILQLRGRGTELLFSGEIQSDNYLRFIVQELKPYIDSSFSTFRDSNHTFIMGSSMGGLISLYAICEYPNVFSGAACLSTHWTGTYSAEGNPIPAAIVRYVSNHLPSPETHRIYFDYGTRTLDTLYEPFQLQVNAVMKSRGFSSANWITRRFEGADHSEFAWSTRLEIPVTFLLATP